MMTHTRLRRACLVAAFLLMAAGAALIASGEAVRASSPRAALNWESAGPTAGLRSASLAGDRRTAITAAPATGTSLRIEPALLKKVAQGAPGARYRVLVELAEGADLASAPVDADRPALSAWVVSQLQSTADRTQAGLLAALRLRMAEGRVASFRPFWVYNAVAVEADAEVILSLASMPEVRLVREDRYRQWTEPFSSMEGPPGPGSDASVQWNVARIRADQAWDAFGLDGTGVTIAIMDTGVDWQHPALIEKYRGYKPGGLVIHVGNWTCTTDEGYLYPVDGNGHGTHVAGTAVGGSDGDGMAIGVAPGARWIAVKMLSDQGYGYDSWIHAAFEWLLAPAGDPSLAPHIVNGAWGSPDDYDEAFRADLQALRSAGIVPVFAAGNNGPSASSLNSPGSYPEALTVGAVDGADQVASFSGRGPSPWGETKPEVAAPGTQIRSSLPGGTYGVGNGTSMAVPHVAGAAAIVLQADPEASVDAVEAILGASALPLGEAVPNNDTGWGRVDAYQAAALASGAGFVAGTVTQLPGDQPLAGARVTAYDHLGLPRAAATTGESGFYRLALVPALYDLEVTAFAFTSQSIGGVEVSSGMTTTVNACLAQLPLGEVSGQVRDAATLEPVEAELSIPGTPAHATSDPLTGHYSLALPEGTFDLLALRNGYRRLTAEGILILPGQATQVNLDLVQAPTLLLVDSGAWYYGSQARYFEEALEDGSYAYDVRTVRQIPEDVPSLEDLAAYDVTLWSSPLDAPGLIGAADVISSYLTMGGGLFLTGQDIGYWDGGLDLVYQDYYTNLLRAVAVADDAGREDVTGVPGDLLEGITLPMNGGDSAGNQYSPDAFRLLDERDAAVLADYAGEGNAALRASGCQSYRAVYLAAGLEGLGDRSSRAEVMERSLAWLGGPQLSAGAGMSPADQHQVWLGQEALTYTLELRNLGGSADRFAFELSPSAWPASVWDSTFSQPMTASLELGSCATQTLGVQVMVPPGERWNTSDAVTLTVRSMADPASSAQARFASKAPAPLLLVDDHRWYGQLARYEAALQALGIPYDVWRIDPVPTPDTHSPSLERLQRYRAVVWFTSFDWYATLTPADELRLSLYLDGGGRLLLSSQDYLFTSGFTPFAREYLGVAGYTESLSSTQVFGAVESPFASGLGPEELLYPFPNLSDALRPVAAAQIAWWGQHGQPPALSMAEGPWKTAFYAFALEALPEKGLGQVLGRTLHWLSPLGDSSLSMDRRVAAPGDTVSCTLLIRNSGPEALASVVLSNTVPPSTSFVPGSLSGPAEYDPVTNRFTWSGSLEPGVTITIGYSLLISPGQLPGASVRNVAHLQEESALELDAEARLRILAPDLSQSQSQVSRSAALPGQVLTYTLALQNDGLAPAQAELVDPTPPFAAYLEGSAWASGGVLSATAGSLAWSGTVLPEQPVIIRYAVIIDPGAAGRYILNRALLDDGLGGSHRFETVTWVDSRRYFPLIWNN